MREEGALWRKRLVGRALPHLSQWSMMDGMLVAIAMVAAKKDGLATDIAQPGLWSHAASAVDRAFLARYADRAERDGHRHASIPR